MTHSCTGSLPQGPALGELGQALSLSIQTHLGFRGADVSFLQGFLSREILLFENSPCQIS